MIFFCFNYSREKFLFLIKKKFIKKGFKGTLALRNLISYA